MIDSTDSVLWNFYRIGNLLLTKFKTMFQTSWKDFEDIQRLAGGNKTKISGQLVYYIILLYHLILYYYYSTPGYVMKHWKEDVMFGYQFLNGFNPVMIEKCTKLPDKLPVTKEMVSVSLERGLTLEEEIKVERLCPLENNSELQTQSF